MRADGRAGRASVPGRRRNTAVRIKWYLPHKEVLARPTGERAGDKQMGGNLQQASRRGFRSDPRPATYIEGHAWVLILEAYTLVLVGGALPLGSPLPLLLLIWNNQAIRRSWEHQRKRFRHPQLLVV